VCKVINLAEWKQKKLEETERLYWINSMNQMIKEMNARYNNKKGED
jgi:hypothetical protein